MFRKFDLIFISRLCIGLLFFNLSFVSLTRAEVKVVDDLGETVILTQPAQRIVSLAPHITETLFSAGAGDKIVGAVSYSDYPEAAKAIPRVGGYPSLDLERIVSLKPDLVIAWTENNPNQIDKLKKFALNIFITDPHHPEDIAKTIQRFGILAGTEKTANKATDDFIRHYNSLKKRFSTKKKVKVFYQIWNKPIMTVSSKSLISDVIELCGGENVFANLNVATPRISLEAVLTSKSDVIISGGMGTARPEWLDEWRKWRELPAVKNNQLYYIDPSLMQRVGPRILQGADHLCEKLELARN
ncbi:MAG: cobalamin-binding protein [Gammaproteobacteria bacterium]|nr:cobalamin-binding protein [Gammaproteobacteria bacterium]